MESNAVYFYEPGAVIPPIILLPGAHDPGQACTSTFDLARQIWPGGGTVARHPNQAEYATVGFFTRIPAIDCDGSKQVILTLVDQGYMRSDGTVLSVPEGEQALQDLSDALPETLSALPTVVAIKDQMEELAAGHIPTSDLNDIVFDFLDTHR